MPILGTELKQLRDALKKQQQEFANELKAGLHTYRSWERAKDKPIPTSAEKKVREHIARNPDLIPVDLKDRPVWKPRPPSQNLKDFLTSDSYSKILMRIAKSESETPDPRKIVGMLIFPLVLKKFFEILDSKPEEKDRLRRLTKQAVESILRELKPEYLFQSVFRAAISLTKVEEANEYEATVAELILELGEKKERFLESATPEALKFVFHMLGLEDSKPPANPSKT